MNLQFKHQGLWVEADLSPFVKATRMDPPEGGDVESLEWMVEDLDELMEYLNMSSWKEENVRRFYLELGHLPQDIISLIDARWDLETVVYETALTEVS
jgi:hypothetical protein